MLKHLRSKLHFLFHFVMLSLSAYCLIWFSWILWEIRVYDQLILSEPNKAIILVEFLFSGVMLCYIMILALLNYWRAFKK